MTYIFAETEVAEIIRLNDEQIENRLQTESDDTILNVNEDEYVDSLVEEFRIEPLEIKFDDFFISDDETDVPGISFPSIEFYVEPSKNYKKHRVTYHLPYSGNEGLIRAKPNPYIAWSIDIFTEDGCICFSIIDFYDNMKKVDGEAQSDIRDIKRQLEHQTKQVEDYNSKLRSKIQQEFTDRKDVLKKRALEIAELGLKVEVTEESPKTFTIPTPEKRKKIKPVIRTEAVLDPTLDDSTYLEILQIINDWGKSIEKLPSAFVNKVEEEIRDELLVALNPYFVGSVTGETFNKSGKTDIVMKYDGNNVFVGECKFWHGKKEYFEAIDQLLNYLTWRDSKTALIIFVKNKKISEVLQTVEKETPNHPNYLNFVNKNEESWFNYTFHFTGDKDREIKLAVLIFHLVG